MSINTSTDLKVTPAAGIPVADNQNSLSAGPRGPLLLQDCLLIEKLQHFNRERISERLVGAKGSGAHGGLTVPHDISRFTKAKLLSAVGKTTDNFVRFSTVGGEKGCADTQRDPRGFAVPSHTEEGKWDLVGNNTPMFFIKDPIKFPDFVHTQKRDPQTNLKSPMMMFDLWSRAPENLHQVAMLFSDRGMSDGYRHMHGFGNHTFSVINAGGERMFVKWHFLTLQGIKNLSAADPVRLAGEGPDHAQRDLFGVIAKDDFPRWEARVQIATEAKLVAWEARTGWNPFDLTKVWPHADFSGAEQNYATVNAAGTLANGHGNVSGFGHGDAGWALSGTAGRFGARGTGDDFTQAGNLFRILPALSSETCSTTWPDL